ncbi:unnamed protein product (macronuclear) [Paramecium tetraurelia]|uniref:HAMP domain-containing protein n=1 Tax=Paramecium tetraurelia TaxID=5888 RepID=A0CY37_PARTE|nr:uncharacterized protein GSPATT00011336001 [Paramecium tetraurelia]CAK75704.1 unnamed protein product [Paramecium tetraurelia]|eukprot:XP_001443101.1 hypothetical protein (macronuclear) [Paramecium tetraurelia strain d4-2]
MAISKMEKLAILNLKTSIQDVDASQRISNCQQAQQYDEPIQKVAICLSNLKVQNESTNSSNHNKKFISFLNVFEGLQNIFDLPIISKQLYFVSPHDHFLTAYYPTRQKNETKELVEYEWFINYITEIQKNSNPSFFKLIPYINLPNYDYLLAGLTMLMIDKNYQINGIAVQILNFPQLTKILFIETLNIIMVYDDGKIMYTQTYVYNGLEKQIRYIYNETISGFNYSDWELIKSSLNFKYPIYIYNSLLNQNVYLKAKQIPNTPLISLILTNLTYENEISKLLNEQIDSILNWQLTLITYTSSISILIILLSLIPLRSLFKPTQVVIEMMMKYLLGRFDYKLKDQVIRENKISQLNNAINQLYQAYQRLDITLNQSQYVKNEHCILIEKFYYEQKKGKMQNFSFENIINQKEQLSLSEFKKFIAMQHDVQVETII